MREILRFRDPGAAVSAVDHEFELGLDRALIIDEFLRVKAQESASLTDAVRGIDEALLRRMRDSGGVTAEVCAVVRFMHGYYSSGRRPPPGRAPDVPDVAAGPPPLPAPSPSPELSDVIPPPPRPLRLARATRRPSEPRSTAPAQAPRAAPVAPVPSPKPQAPAKARAPAGVEVATLKRDLVERAERERIEAQEAAALRSTAQILITEMEGQLQVPRYLTFREARVETPELPGDELEARRQMSLRATERVVVLLTRLTSEPTLREAVQASLGPNGRARIERGIMQSFRSVPDARQRERAVRLWSELEASASVKR